MFHYRMVKLIARRVLVSRGYDGAQVDVELSHITDDFLVHASGQVGLGVVQGELVDWIISHRAQILQLVEIIVHIISLILPLLKAEGVRDVEGDSKGSV